MFSPFTYALGIHQGSISSPVNHSIPEGTSTYVLGHDLKDQYHYLKPGDEVSIAQTAEFNDGDNVRLLGYVRRATDVLPPSWSWVLKVEIVGVFTYEYLLDGSTFNNLQEFAVIDDALGINVSQAAAGPQTLKYTLRLDGPGTDAIYTELPAVYIDSVHIDQVLSDLFLNQRYPEENQVEVLPASLKAKVQVSDTTGVGFSLIPTQVYVNGTLAYSGASGFQVGFSGTVTVQGIASSDLTISLDLSAQTYSSEEIVDIRVVAETIGSASTIDQTYSYTMSDVVAPTISDIEALDKQLLKIVFNEDVVPDLATNTENYTIVRNGFPSSSVEVCSIDFIDSKTYHLHLDVEATFGASYTLVTSNITDFSGNAVVPPGNELEFQAYSPNFPVGRRIDFYNRYVPEINRQEDVTKDLYRFISVIQESINLWFCLTDEFIDIIDIDKAPGKYIDIILENLGNPFKFGLSDLDKRSLAKVLISIYQQKGTCFGIINTVRFFLGLEVVCDEFNLGDYWDLGISELGESTILGPSELRLIYSFRILKNETAEKTLTFVNAQAGDYIIAIDEFVYLHTATTETEEQLRDVFFDKIDADPGVRATPTKVGTTEISLISDVGTSFAIIVVQEPSAGDITQATVTNTTPFTDEELVKIKQIVNYMKPANMHCTEIVQPVPAVEITHWTLGVSSLGESTVLN